MAAEQTKINAYIDASIVVRLLFAESDPLRGWGRWKRAVSSEFILVEVLRAVERVYVLGAVTATEYTELARSASILVGTLELVAVDTPVLRRAASHFPAVVSAPDALHLATAMSWEDETGDRLVFWTHDPQLRVAAEAAGVATSGR